MNKKILLLVIFLTTLTCSAKTEKSIPEQRLEGWAGNPDNPNEKPFDYFYMRSKGRGNEKAFKKKYGALLYKTCIDSATVAVKGDLIGKIIDEIVPSRSSPSGQLYLPSQIQKLQSINTTKADVQSQTKLDSFDLINLVAFSGTSICARATFVCELAGLQGVWTKNCMPLAIPVPDFPNSEWKECECIIYVRITGGKEKVIKDLEQMDNMN